MATNLIDLTTDEVLSPTVSDIEREQRDELFYNFCSSLPRISNWQAKRYISLLQEVDDTSIISAFQQFRTLFGELAVNRLGNLLREDMKVNVSFLRSCAAFPIPDPILPQTPENQHTLLFCPESLTPPPLLEYKQRKTSQERLIDIFSPGANYVTLKQISKAPTPISKPTKTHKRRKLKENQTFKENEFTGSIMEIPMETQELAPENWEIFAENVNNAFNEYRPSVPGDLAAHLCRRVIQPVPIDLELWSEDEERALISHAALYGNAKWKQLVFILPNKTEQEYFQFYEYFLARPNNRWTKGQLRILREKAQKMPWNIVAKHVNKNMDHLFHHSPLQCKEKSFYLS